MHLFTTSQVFTLTFLFLSPFASTQNTTGPWTDWPTDGLTDYEAVIQTVNLEAISTDTRDWSLIPQIFTEDIWASYHPDIPPFVGLANLTTFLITSVEGFTCQHLQGTQMVKMGEDKITANATTFAQATLFADPLQTPGQVVYFYGYYNDQLVKTDQGWRIRHRVYRFISRGSVGNLTLLGQ